MSKTKGITFVVTGACIVEEKVGEFLNLVVETVSVVTFYEVVGCFPGWVVSVVGAVG